jgi:iron complex outermembrane receptor protein
MLRGDNLSIHTPLPFMPADHGRVGFRLNGTQTGKLYQPYFSVHTTIYARQNRIAENEPLTAGYTLFDLAAGSQWNIGKTALQINISVNNLFNKAYTDHLSNYRDFALNPGRNIIMKIKIPFDVIKGS